MVIIVRGTNNASPLLDIIQAELMGTNQPNMGAERETLSILPIGVMVKPLHPLLVPDEPGGQSVTQSFSCDFAVTLAGK